MTILYNKKMSILLDKKFNDFEYKTTYNNSGKLIKNLNQVKLIFSDVYDLLFLNNFSMIYTKEQLLQKINIKEKIDEKLGECVFIVCQNDKSLFDCQGPDNINIYLDSNSTAIKVSMTIAHELMHIYFHLKKHLNKHIVYINGEEGLCELVAFYIGCLIRSKGYKIEHSEETNQMLRNYECDILENLSWKQEHIYKKYIKYFHKAFREFMISDSSLKSFIDNYFSLKGLQVLN